VEQLTLPMGPLARSTARIDADVAELGRQGARDGMRRAAAHADAVLPHWSDRALALLAQFVRESRGREFITPDFRRYAVDLGFDSPPEPRAWGAVVNAAARRGLIVKTGRMRPYGDRTSHTNPKQCWRAA
jgi:hypothetical protein